MMTRMREVRFRAFEIGADRELSLEQTQEICRLCASPTNKPDGSLSGRTSVTFGDLGGIGPVVVKHYRRGGLLRHLVAQRYLRVGWARSRSEFELLKRVRSLGVSAPEPVAYITQGRLLYRTWLVMREVEQHKTLATLSCEAPGEAQDLLPAVVQQIERLIGSGIWHVDLHPGNVLIDSQGEIFLIDFDKAHSCNDPIKRVRDRYLCRWRRAVIKHGLPEFLLEGVSLGLRRVREAESEISGEISESINTDAG